MDCLVLLTYGSGVYDRLVNISGNVKSSEVDSNKNEHFKSNKKENQDNDGNIAGLVIIGIISLLLTILGFALPFYAMYLSLKCNDKHPSKFSKYGMAVLSFILSFFYVIYYFIRYKVIGDKCMYA